MPRDGSGNFSLVAGNPVAGGTPIDPVWANSTLNDLATAMTDSLSRSGDGGMLAPFLNDDGAKATPGITWVLEPGSGFYRDGTNDMRASVAGGDTTRWVDDSGSPAGEQTPFEIWNGTAFTAPFVVGGSLTLTNDDFMQGRNAADSAWIDVVKVNTSNQIQFGAAAVLMSSSALTVSSLTVNGTSTITGKMTLANELRLTPLNGGGTQTIGIDNDGDVIVVAGSSGADLNNDAYMLGRNFAGTAWIDMMKVNTSDEIEFGASVVIFPSTVLVGGVLRLDNDTWLQGRNLADTANINMLKVLTGNTLSLGASTAVTGNLSATGSLTVTGLASADLRAAEITSTGLLSKGNYIRKGFRNDGTLPLFTTVGVVGMNIERISVGVFVCNLDENLDFPATSGVCVVNVTVEDTSGTNPSIATFMQTAQNKVAVYIRQWNGTTFVLADRGFSVQVFDSGA